MNQYAAVEASVIEDDSSSLVEACGKNFRTRTTPYAQSIWLSAWSVIAIVNLEY